MTRLWREEEGMSMLEWAVLAAVFVAAAALGFQALSTSISSGMTNAGTDLETLDMVP